jgi:hypothetical protein
MKTHAHARLAALTTVSVLALVLVACGSGESPTAASCMKSWNAAANADQQATLAGTVSADISFDGEFRVGTWPKSDQKVPVSVGFSEKPSGETVAQKGSCVLVLPPSRVGQMAFVEAKGKWKFVADEASEFPRAARRELAGAKAATPDALGKLKLEGGGEA